MFKLNLLIRKNNIIIQKALAYTKGDVQKLREFIL